MSYLLDTNIISELASKRPNERVIRWIDSVDDQRVFLSVITIGEIKRGIEKLSESQRKDNLNKWLDGDLLMRFDGRILTVDLPVILIWGGLVARMGKLGRSLPAIDSLIAAIVLNHGLTLVTRNEKDFAGTGVAALNPWLE